MQVRMMRVRTSQRRKRRLLQVQSSSHHRLVVLSHPVVPLPPRLGEAEWREACLPSWLRWQTEDEVSHYYPLFFSFFAVMCARGLAHSPSTRMHLYALKSLYLFADLFFQCLHVVHFLSCFCCLLSTIVSTTLSARGLAH